MVDLRVVYTAMLKASIDYILEDIEEPKLFEMVSIIAKLAEQSAHARRERKLQAEQQEEQERWKDINSLSLGLPRPTQQRVLTGAQIGAQQRG